MPDGGGGWVLCYHLVGGGVGGPVDLDVGAFTRHLDHLVARGDVRALAEVAHDGRGVALTFDDAFANFADVVWPLLQARKLPVTLFVPTGFVDGTHPSPLSTATSLRPCSWSALRDMARDGLTLGSHTRTHRNLRRVADDDIDADVRAAKARIEDQVGVTARAFCYPQAKWSSRVEQVVRRRHDVIVTGGGTRVSGRRPWRVPRVSIVRGGWPLALLLRLPFEPREWIANQTRQRR